MAADRLSAVLTEREITAGRFGRLLESFPPSMKGHRGRGAFGAPGSAAVVRSSGSFLKGGTLGAAPGASLDGTRCDPALFGRSIATRRRESPSPDHRSICCRCRDTINKTSAPEHHRNSNSRRAAGRVHAKHPPLQRDSRLSEAPARDEKRIREMSFNGQLTP